MVDLSREIDFSKEIAKDPSIAQFIQQAAKEIAEAAGPESILKPELDLDLKNYVLVTGVPAVPKKTVPILTGVIKDKVLSTLQIDQKYGLTDVKVGLKQDGSSNRSMILKYDTQDNAQRAIPIIHGKRLDPVNMFDADFLKCGEEVMNSGDLQYVEPVQFKREIAQAHNIDTKLRDQFVYREGDEVQLNWFDFMEKKPIKVSDQTVKFQKVSRVQWSILGTYLVCYHSNGFSLHSGINFAKVGWFPHNKVLKVKFSPDETYIVSFNGTVYAPDRQNFVVWETKMNKKLRAIRSEQTQTEESFKFSHDSKYIAGAYTTNGTVAVFELPSMSMIEELPEEGEETQKEERHQKSVIRVQHIMKFAWHTTKHILICLCYAPVRDKTVTVSTTRVRVIQIPTRRELKWKNWAHDAGNGDIVVAANGDWAAVVLEKLYKRKIVSTVIQIASFKKKELEIDLVQVQEKQVDIGWDIYNGRFSVVVCNVDTKQSLVKLFTATFFAIEQEAKGQTVKQIGQVTNQNTNKVLLSSNGLFFVMYSVDGRGNFTIGYLNKTEKNFTVEVIKANLSHAYMQYLSFDPSGKYLLLGSYNCRSIQIWSILGQLLFRDAMMRPLTDICWRPRLIRFLSPPEELQLQNGWKAIKAKYEDLDDRIINAIKYQREQEQKKLKSQFNTFIEKKREFLKQFAKQKQVIQNINQKTARTAKYEVREKITPIVE